MTQLAAVNLLIAALTDLGRLDEIDTAEGEVARGMVRAIDDSDQQNAALWREYRAAVRALKDLYGASPDGQLDRLLAELSGPAGDPETRRATLTASSTPSRSPRTGRAARS